MTMVNLQCALLSKGNEGFPCNANAIQVVSLSVGASALSLIFVLYLIHQVRYDTIRDIQMVVVPSFSLTHSLSVLLTI
jgi:hypothetical protein